MTDPCVFCDIIAGREAAEVVRDREGSLGIVPLDPVAHGHVIFMPKVHVRDAVESPIITGRVMEDASSWVRQQRHIDSRHEHVNVITSVGRPATQSVFHLHIHVVPRAENDGLALPWTTDRERDAAVIERLADRWPVMTRDMVSRGQVRAWILDQADAERQGSR